VDILTLISKPFYLIISSGHRISLWFLDVLSNSFGPFLWDVCSNGRLWLHFGRPGTSLDPNLEVPGTSLCLLGITIPCIVWWIYVVSNHIITA